MFSSEDFSRLIPSELSGAKKENLISALQQFSKENNNKIDYYIINFFRNNDDAFFLQGDLIREIKFPVFDIESKQYSKEYFDAILISSTCDVEPSNHSNRKVKKNAILAKVLPLADYYNTLKELGIKNSEEIILTVKNQQYSNIFYFPKSNNADEGIAFLDDLTIMDLEEIHLLLDNKSENLVSSLDQFGYYLFTFKLSYHLCRLPSESYR